MQPQPPPQARNQPWPSPLIHYPLHFTPTLFQFARILLVAALFAAPLAFGAVQPWAWASLAGLAAAMLFLWSVGCVQQGSLKLAWSPLYLPGALFLLLGTIQLFAHLTLDPMATREALLNLATNLVFFFLACQLLAASPKKILRAFGRAVLFYAFALALFGILQFFSSHGLIYWRRSVSPGQFFGPYVNHNHYAGLMEMLIPISAGYVLSRPGIHPRRALLGFALLVPMASLLLCGSRGGFVSMLAEVAILGGILMGQAGAPERRRLAVAGGLGLTATALLFFWMDPGQISQHLRTLASLTHSPETTLDGRVALARDSLRIFTYHPWVGTGLGSFETVFPQYQSFASDFTWKHAHNDYAEALAETGLAGALLILGALALFFAAAFKNLSELLRHDIGWIQLGAALGCCGLLVHSLVDFNFHVPANAAWFAVCAAIATCKPAGRRGFPQPL